MSIASLLQILGIDNVPPVPRPETEEETKNTSTEQACSPRSLCSPHKFERIDGEPEPLDPETVLLDIAQTLQATPACLGALLDSDDIKAIALGKYSLAYLMAYFRLMRSDGKQLVDDQPTPTRAPVSHSDHVERVQTWKPTHDELINHVMTCHQCYAPRRRYCSEGRRLRHNYHTAYEQFLNTHKAAATLPCPTK